MAASDWTSAPLPADTVAAVRAGVAPLTDQILTEVRATNPVYRDVLGGPEGIGIRLGIEQAISAFLDAIERGERPGSAPGEVWGRLGEAEFQAGRSLESLRLAFRTGVRAAWRTAAELAASAGVPTQVVISLAEAIFVYAEELTNDVVDGYLRIQSDEATERERRRRRLAVLLVDPAEHDPEAIERAAELARWSVPATVAAVALPGDTPARVARRLDPDVLPGADSGGVFLLIPDPSGPGRASAVKRAMTNTTAGLGPAVPPREAHRSLRWARLALRLALDGTIRSSGLIGVEEHLADVILLQDRGLAAELARTRLKALEPLPAAERDRLLDTLAAWFTHQRHTPGIAAELHVHPQTVRYRMARLRELLGEAMDTADGRFELELAVRVRSALGPPPQ